MTADDHYPCPECNLPLCSEACYKSRKYHSAECALLAKIPSGHKMSVVFDRKQ